MARTAGWRGAARGVAHGCSFNNFRDGNAGAVSRPRTRDGKRLLEIRHKPGRVSRDTKAPTMGPFHRSRNSRPACRIIKGV